MVASKVGREKLEGDEGVEAGVAGLAHNIDLAFTEHLKDPIVGYRCTDHDRFLVLRVGFGDRSNRPQRGRIFKVGASPRHRLPTYFHQP